MRRPASPDAARIEQLEAELRRLCERDLVAQREIAALRDENHVLREQQTATAEVLRVIARSPTDLQSVLQVVAQDAARRCNAENASIFRLEGDRVRKVAGSGPVPGTPAVGETTPLAPPHCRVGP